MSSFFQKILESDFGNRLLTFAIEHRQRFFITLICLFIVYVFLCLFSYSPTDPAWSHSSSNTSAHVNNVGGVGGAWLADMLYVFFGKMAWLLILWLVMETYFVLVPNRYYTALRVCSYGFLWVCACILLAAVGTTAGLEPTVAGVVGQSLFVALSSLLGVVGTYLFALVGLLGLGYLMVLPLYQGRHYFSDFLTKSSANTSGNYTMPISVIVADSAQDFLPPKPKPNRKPRPKGILDNFLVNSDIQAELYKEPSKQSDQEPAQEAKPQNHTNASFVRTANQFANQSVTEANQTPTTKTDHHFGQSSKPIDDSAMVQTKIQPKVVQIDTSFDNTPKNSFDNTPKNITSQSHSPVIDHESSAIGQESVIQKPIAHTQPPKTAFAGVDFERLKQAQQTIFDESDEHQQDLSSSVAPHQSVQSSNGSSSPNSAIGGLIYEYKHTPTAQSYQLLFSRTRPIPIKASDVPKQTTKGEVQLDRVIAHSNIQYAPPFLSTMRDRQGQVIELDQRLSVSSQKSVEQANTKQQKTLDQTSGNHLNGVDDKSATMAVSAPTQATQSTQATQVNSTNHASDTANLTSTSVATPPKPIRLELVPDEPAYEPVISEQPTHLTAAASRHDQTFNQTSYAIHVAKHQASLPALPPLTLLDERPIHGEGYSETELVQLSGLLEIKLKEFGVNAEVMSISQGPVITSFEVALAAGVKASKVTGIAQDLARSLSVGSVRVVEVIAGKPYIGIEIPNKTRQTIRLIELLDTPEYQAFGGHIAAAIGKSSTGEVVMTDIYTAPHMLIAGATRSGKSVLVNGMLVSMLLKYTPQELRFVMIDPKLLELTIYDDIPHLLTPVITDMNDSMVALSWCVNEMNRRYQVMNAIKVRQISDYNKKVKQAIERGEPLLDKTWQANDSVTQSTPPTLKPMPYIVVVVDEYADLVSQVKQVEERIDALARKSRAAGIHIILATQRPSVDVITGVIKANIPARIALSVRQRVDSRTILDTAGAETLLGNGDMLFIGNNCNDPIRVHGAYVTDEEVDRVCEAWRARGVPDYVDMQNERNTVPIDSPEGQDELYQEAVNFVLETGKTSISSVQRQLSIGYNRAAKIIDAMEAQGVLSAPDHTSKRTILK